MPDILKVIDAAVIPANPDNLPWKPWPTLMRIVTRSHKTGNEWLFHYDDGTTVSTRDAAKAEALCRILFPNGPPRNEE